MNEMLRNIWAGEVTAWRRILCWLTGLGMHRIDLLSVAYGARFICMRCGKDCGYSSAAVSRP
jgi:hypothetical protein